MVATAQLDQDATTTGLMSVSISVNPTICLCSSSQTNGKLMSSIKAYSVHFPQHSYHTVTITNTSGKAKLFDRSLNLGDLILE